MPEKLLIILLNTDPSSPGALGAPFFQATVAASMEYEVEIVFTGSAGLLAKRGVAQGIPLPGSEEGVTIYDLIRQAVDAGVILKVCAPAREFAGGDMIEEIEETVAGGYLIAQAMSGRTVTFTY